MPASLAGAVDLIQPHLVPAIATPALWPRLRHLAGCLPPALPAGFECRLADDTSPIDLLQAVLREAGGPARLRQHIETTALAAQPAWQRVREFCTAWSVPASALNAGMERIWLEFDLDGAGWAESAPSVFLTFDTERAAFPDSFGLALQALPWLLGQPPSRPLAEALEACFRACTGRVVVSHVGVMLARAGQALRVNVPRLTPSQAPSFLRQVGWPGDLAHVQALLDWVYARADHVTLALDVGAAVSLRLGLECSVDETQPPADQARRWEVMLDDLAARGVCTPARRDAVLAWPGLTLPNAAPQPWPAHLIAQSLSAPAGEFSALRRRISHLKLVHQPAQPWQAKAYLGFEHLWLRP
jgi:hypothetical protein